MNDPNQALRLFRAATDHILRRMARDDRFAYLMAGSEGYAKLLEAHAASTGATLPEFAEMANLQEVWTALHPEPAEAAPTPSQSTTVAGPADILAYAVDAALADLQTLCNLVDDSCALSVARHAANELGAAISKARRAAEAAA